MLFISHDLSVVRYLADRVVVMYLGYIVEQGTTDQIFAPPYHPYTEALLSAIPIADTSVVKKHIVLEGDVPSAMNPPPGCPFQTRCRYKHLVPDNLCETEAAALQGTRPWPQQPVLALRRDSGRHGAGHQLRASEDKDDPAARPPAHRAGRSQAAHMAEEPGGEFDEGRPMPEPIREREHPRQPDVPTTALPERMLHEVGEGREALSDEVEPAEAPSPREQAEGKAHVRQGTTCRRNCVLAGGGAQGDWR